MATKTNRIKAKAQTYAPQSQTACAADIKKLGDLQRQRSRMAADMNDEIAAITKRYQPGIDELGERINLLQEGVQTYCEAHRDELTNGGKVKTANLITGEINWRQRPPSVSIRGAEAVLETLARMGLTRFIRTKQEPNKEAMLNEPDAVRGIAGINVVTGVEDFVITPFEAEVEGA
jgi:phage host-nuclease inhibitor protein Gam